MTRHHCVHFFQHRHPLQGALQAVMHKIGRISAQPDDVVRLVAVALRDFGAVGMLPVQQQHIGAAIALLPNGVVGAATDREANHAVQGVAFNITQTDNSYTFHSCWGRFYAVFWQNRLEF